MKHLKLFTLLGVLVLTFAACAAPPQPPVPEEELAACKAVLDEIQSLDSYYIHSYTEYDSDQILNNYNDIHLWVHGDSWVQTNELVDDLMFADLCKDGQYFNNEGDIHYTGKNGTKWRPADAKAAPQTWLQFFDWESSSISYVSTGYPGSAKIVTVSVNDPFDRGTDAFNIADGYTAEFHFDGKGNFEKVVLHMVFSQDGREKETEILEILSTDPEKISKKIDREYSRALEQNGLSR